LNLRIPVMPNSPISEYGSQCEGDLNLRILPELDFLENSSFDIDLLDYDESYQIDQSISPAFTEHMSEMYQIICDACPKGGKLVEIGCGKGAFLKLVSQDTLFEYTGYDSSYEGDDPNIIKRYLTLDDNIFADVIVLRHTLEHIAQPYEFIQLLKQIFPPNALLFIEVPQFDWIKKHRVLFDFTYEHVNYFSRKSLTRMFHKIVNSGGCFGDQYQFCIAHLRETNAEWSTLYSSSEWKEFDIKPYFKSIELSLSSVPSDGSLWIWGGGTKGVLFLNYMRGLFPEKFNNIKGVIDINKNKQNLFTPGTHKRIISPKKAFREFEIGDTVLVMNPNYYEEVSKIIEDNNAIEIIVISV